MKLKYTILYVESVSATLDFYEKSFGFKTKFLHEAGDYGELDTGETTLSFSSLKLMKDLGKNLRVHLELIRSTVFVRLDEGVPREIAYRQRWRHDRQNGSTLK